MGGHLKGTFRATFHAIVPSPGLPWVSGRGAKLSLLQCYLARAEASKSKKPWQQHASCAGRCMYCKCVSQPAVSRSKQKKAGIVHKSHQVPCSLRLSRCHCSHFSVLFSGPDPFTLGKRNIAELSDQKSTHPSLLVPLGDDPGCWISLSAQRAGEG